MELPQEAAFCARCGNPTGNPPVYPPAPPFRQAASTNTSYLLLGCYTVGMLVLTLLFIIFILFALAPSFVQPSGQPSGGGGGGRCCGMPEQVAFC